MDKTPVIVTPQHLPEVEIDRSKSTRKYAILTSWASAATAVLLVVLILGAVYVSELKTKQCQRSTATSGNNTMDYSRKYIQEDNSEKDEDIHVDKDEQTEVITTKSPDGNIDMIYALDYKRKISTAYIPSIDQCLLVAGEDAEMLDDWDPEKNKTEHVAKEDLFEKDYRTSANKITDLSILPRAIKPFCEGKGCFWAELVPEGSDVDGDDADVAEAGAREKRSTWCWIQKCVFRRCGFLWRKRCKDCYNSKKCYGPRCYCR